ncbi:MAG TPA: amidohydrolase [Candidatus Limnocylindria bacterium]|nr:amidohydrolase [Candidatus Limnocylindria bacterium]
MSAALYTLIADDVLTLDARRTHHSPGAVGIEGVQISYVGPPPKAPTGTVVRLEGCVLLPGLINVHTHTPMWLFRGLTEDVPRGEWLAGRMRPLEARVGPNELRAGALAGCLEMLLGGVTTIADRYSDMGEIAGAVEESGLRAVIAHSLYDESAERGLRASAALLERFGADPERSRVWVGLGPHATDTCGPQLLRQVAALAERTGARVFIHLAQSEAEVAAVRARGEVGCAAYLDSRGLLGPTVVVAHGTYLREDEADLVGRRRTAVAHCPSSNAKLEGRVAPVARMRRAGAVIGLGTDAACCNNGMDLFAEMRTAGLLNKVAADDPTAFPVAELLRMVTSEAAAVLGIAHLVGSLEIGKRADVIAVDQQAPHIQPWHDPVANLVYAARGSDVRAVFVDGQPLVLDRRPVRLDAERILADGAQAARVLAPVAVVR